jgi:hypothetical protein
VGEGQFEIIDIATMAGDLSNKLRTSIMPIVALKTDSSDKSRGLIFCRWRHHLNPRVV